ncbi:MAG: YidC/Oxa1 family membrane protein insertase [Patescibacteria group bacterium]|nr:YidC/Oxa1 family membrane protein insertase [Patescibacteria group bacterium]
MFSALWHNVVFNPLYNFLMYLYFYHANFNLGWAVVYMTLILRLLLVPFSVITERGKEFYRRISDKVTEAQKDYADDQVKQKTVIRDLLRQNKIRPWSNLIVLLFHVLILVAFYQVFVGGMKVGAIVDSLYPSIPRPDVINTNWICFGWGPGAPCLDIKERSLPFAAVVAVVLFIEITLGQRGRKGRLTQQEIVYRFLFPAFTFVALGLLPSVKSLFILTSLLFSIMISLGGTLFWGFGTRRKAKGERQAAMNAAARDPFDNNFHYGRQPR